MTIVQKRKKKKRLWVACPGSPTGQDHLPFSPPTATWNQKLPKRTKNIIVSVNSPQQQFYLHLDVKTKHLNFGLFRKKGNLYKKRMAYTQYQKQQINKRETQKEKWMKGGKSDTHTHTHSRELIYTPKKIKQRETA